ncbi:hypothetical protein NWP22_17760 [Anabaenopsis tanganyikae CS-531]|uniref:Uncharacterized protein n=2 Tax=Anabaenopsis TaxID=110103 RepID=A0ABT6KIF5_9CYAN|nr:MULTISPECIES: hypothetical protein [Anabaenopsis]MDB9538680.1 hypothetical protein [Anabaenopsis arnoldii]MDH6090954.1 hypothetical protein [Anabaenopsis arnoldii]MDH6107681.1 hypothetical protein [Anabaenopsis tanganyikae CS-531]
MYSTSPHQKLLEAIANLSEQQIPLVLQFISSLETPVSDYQTPAKTVLERMGGYPKFLLEGSGDLSDRDVRKKAISDIIQATNQTRTHE